MANTPRDPVAKPPKRPVWVKVAMAMGALAVLFVILSLTGVLPGGLGGHGPGRHLGGGDAYPSPKQQASRGVGAPADESEADRTIEVATLDTMSFEPSDIEVSAGETVTFVVTNAGQSIHEFTIGDEAMQQEHAEAMEHIPAGMAHATANSITLKPDETKRLTWRFGDVTLEYACHQAGHYEAGMRGRITVT